MRDMKHLKLFENYDELYSIITREEFAESTQYRNIKFDSRLKQQIIDRLTGGWVTETMRKFGHIYDFDIYLKKEDYDGPGYYPRLHIISVKDEWFYFESNTQDLINNRYQYYKCDQFEGLIKLLKDLKIIN